MIVPRGVIVPLALLVALATTTTLFSLGIREAPAAFFSGADVVVGPPHGQLPGNLPIDARLVPAIRALPNVSAVSPEIFAPGAFAGHSVMARGVDGPTFLEMERATLLEGSLPGGPADAVVGAGLARTLGVASGDRIVFASSFARFALPLTVTGVLETRSVARDEVIVTLDAARSLTYLGPNDVHLIRIATNDSDRVRALMDAVTPTFTLSHVEISTNDLIPGEAATASADLTNWGRATGDHVVTVRNGPAIIGSASFRVPGRETLHVAIPFQLDRTGATNISINPTFAVAVRGPTLRLASVPIPEAGEAFQLGIVSHQGGTPEGVTVIIEALRLEADEGGVAHVPGLPAGRHRVVLEQGGDIEGIDSVFVAEEGSREETRIRVHAISVAERVMAGKEMRVQVSILNHGGIGGTYAGALLLDGTQSFPFAIGGGPGETVTREVILPSLLPGPHSLIVEGTSLKATTVAIDGEPRIESLLEAYEAQRASTQAPSSQASEGIDYVANLMGNVTAAVLALAVAASALTALGAIAVLERHLATRAKSIGLLKALGATDDLVLRHAGTEAATRAFVAVPLGILGGAGLAGGIDALHIVRGFGHAIHPAYGWAPLLTLLIISILLIALLSRMLVAGMLSNRADALLRDALVRKPTSEIRQLAEAIPEEEM